MQIARRWIACLLLACGPHLRATDTAFWKPYAQDEQTLLLLQGDATSRLPGRFGGGLVFTGGAGRTIPSTTLLQSGMLSLEAWVQLTGYSPAGATILTRPHLQDASRGFHFGITPEGGLRLTVHDLTGTASTLASAPGVVPLNQWLHVAAVTITGRYQLLYVNGTIVARQTLGPDHGLRGDQGDERMPQPFVVGDRLRGILDEVRVHQAIHAFWPPPETAWLGRISREGLPPLESLLAAPNQPRLYLSFNGDEDAAVTSSEAPPGVQLMVRGRRTAGVEGQALRGMLAVTFEEPPAIDLGGTLSFWVHPTRLNSYASGQHNLLSSSLFNVQLANRDDGPRPLSFSRGGEDGEAIYDDARRTELHAGRWLHLVFAWDSSGVTMYIDGREAAVSAESFIREGDHTFTGFSLNQHGDFGDLDEVLLFERRLSEGEIANLHARYVAPAAIRAAPPLVQVRLQAWHLPSLRRLAWRLQAAPEVSGRALLTLHDAATGTVVYEHAHPYSADLQTLTLPDLPDGTYRLTASIQTENETLLSNGVVFTRQHFAWEGNMLGTQRQVYPPFEPVVASGFTVAVVGRRYTMNGFGLWDSIVAEERELLAAPMTIRGTTGDGQEIAWNTGEPRLLAAADDIAAWVITAESPNVTIQTLSEVEMDGMMRVTMTLAPGSAAGVIDRLWLEIPLHAATTTRMHTDSGMAGQSSKTELPAGEGVVWGSAQATRAPEWLNAFTSYVWLGGERQGLAWFAENDRGWSTHKDGGERSLQTISRDGDRVVLRVYLINQPTRLTSSQQLVFGLHASPTRPRVANGPTAAHEELSRGIPPVPWGGLSSAFKFPYDERWEAVDKVLEMQKSGKVDDAWFRAYEAEHAIPPVQGTTPWSDAMIRIAHQRQRPIFVQMEDMKALTTRPEWQTFQDEWSLKRLRSRAWPEPAIFRREAAINPALDVNLTGSYRDYGTWYANEWLRRGISIYWENPTLKLSTNPWTSAAYATADGHVQPATTLWNQRAYMKRVWNLLHEWRQHHDHPLDFAIDVSYANLLPLLSWCSITHTPPPPTP